MDQSLEYQHSWVVYNNMVHIYKGKFIRITTYFIDDSVLKVKSENQMNSFSFSCQFNIISRIQLMNPRNVCRILYSTLSIILRGVGLIHQDRRILPPRF